MIKIKRGLDLPIDGAPRQEVSEGPEISRVGIIGYDYPGLKPSMHVSVGDQVVPGQPLFSDKKIPGLRFCSPLCGEIVAINRGEKRVLESVEIEIGPNRGEPLCKPVEQSKIIKLGREEVLSQLVASGQWQAFRGRPYGRSVPPKGKAAEAIFITSADTRPHCPKPPVVINDRSEEYLAGIDVVSVLTDGHVFVCSNEEDTIPLSRNPKVINETFTGPHPAGNAGTHIHFLHPVHLNRSVWQIGYQDVIAIGAFFLSGHIDPYRVVSLAGPRVSNPSLYRTLQGASISDLTEGKVFGAENRVISGSVIDGRRAYGPTAFLGRFHNQISVIREGFERDLLEFVSPGAKKFSLTNLFLGSFRKMKFDMSTSTEGSPRSIFPLGTYERTMPMDILATPLLKALVVDDLEAAIDLGALELEEEDIALCTFACPGKYEYGPYLRKMLTRIQEES